MRVHPLWDNVVLRRAPGGMDAWEIMAVGPGPIVEYGYETPMPDILRIGQIVTVEPDVQGNSPFEDNEVGGLIIIVSARDCTAVLEDDEEADEGTDEPGADEACVEGEGDERLPDDPSEEDGEDDSGEGSEQNHED